MQGSIVKLVQVPLTLQGAGSGNAPTLSTGDPNGTYFSVTAHASTGLVVVTTKDAFVSIPSVQATLCLATPAVATVCVGPTPTHNSNGTWSFSFNIFVSGSAADLGASDKLFLLFSFQNSSVVV